MTEKEKQNQYTIGFLTGMLTAVILFIIYGIPISLITHLPSGIKEAAPIAFLIAFIYTIYPTLHYIERKVKQFFERNQEEK